MILAILIICLASLSPIPSLPLVLLYYTKFGFVKGFFVVTIASNIKIFMHYFIGNVIAKRKINILGMNEKIHSFRKKYKSMRSKDILFLRLSNLFIVRLLNTFLGFIGFPLVKTFVINNIAIVPWQLVYYYSATKIDILSSVLTSYGLNVSIVKVLSIVSVTSIFYILIRFIYFILKKINFKLSQKSS